MRLPLTNKRFVYEKKSGKLLLQLKRSLFGKYGTNSHINDSRIDNEMSGLLAMQHIHFYKFTNKNYTSSSFITVISL